MPEKFDSDEAKKFLLAREKKENADSEIQRQTEFERAIAVLKKEFHGSNVEVYLVGSILKPFSFSSHSDIDIVLKNFTGDRFDLWGKLEKKLGRTVEIIIFETCHFKEFVLKEGYKVL